MSTTLLMLPAITLAVGFGGGWILRSTMVAGVTESDWRRRMATRDQDLRAAQDHIAQILAGGVPTDA